MREVSARAEIITKRTYCRPTGEYTFEEWVDVVDRVIGHQRWLWERALTHQVLPGMMLKEVTEDMEEWVLLNAEQEEELSTLREVMLVRKGLPSGRTLWLGGTDISKTRESCMFNCSSSSIETVYDIVDNFWLLLQGCGIGGRPIVGALSGFRTPILEVEVIRSTRKDKGREDNEETYHNGVWTISVGDSAEAWAKSIGKLMAGKHKAHKLVLDFSEIRPAGNRLKGYGWVSSGDASISEAYPAISEIMNRRAGNLLSKIDIVEIMNHLGTVLSSRRSAEIMLVDFASDEWEEFATMKSNCFEEGFRHKQQSNNSLVFNHKPSRQELTNLFDMIIDSGGSEPGFINGQTAKQRAPWFNGVNPCGEILLPNKGFCNLVEIDVGKFKGDTANLHKVAVLLARANYRQTVVDLRDGILQEAWHLNNEFLRLCGVGATGIAKRDDMTEYEWKNLNKSANFGARTMAKELGLQYPKNVTTVKPSGTLGKIMDTSEGIHRPEARYLFNWVNFSVHDEKVERLKASGYKTLENPADSTGILVCLPVEFDNITFGKKEVTRKDGTIEVLEVNTETALVQLARYKKLQVNYCDQNVSNTIYYKPEERDDIVDWILTNWDIYVGLSFLFKNDPTVSAKDLGYDYLPQEYVTKEAYHAYVDILKEVDWEDTGYASDFEDDCGAIGFCPMK